MEFEDLLLSMGHEHFIVYMDRENFMSTTI